ncbi:MAG: hypothetical protein AAGD38_01210, partial [Acidobacteriota bacterium]
RHHRRQKLAACSHPSTSSHLCALAGQADRDRDGAITSSELESHLDQTVRDLTDGTQTPTMAKGGLPDLVVVPDLQ